MVTRINFETFIVFFQVDSFVLFPHLCSGSSLAPFSLYFGWDRTNGFQQKKRFDFEVVHEWRHAISDIFNNPSPRHKIFTNHEHKAVMAFMNDLNCHIEQ